MDVGNSSGACALQDCFDETPVGVWVAANAHTHGFIIRYPEGEQSVTGYTYEPWHLRYIGTNLAGKIHAGARAVGASDVDTLEEYFKLEPAPTYLS
jgi:D-alanyl-D-alanine carboxypeptidase